MTELTVIDKGSHCEIHQGDAIAADYVASVRLARMFAAAPEMLAALRAARDDLSDLLEVSDLTDAGVADTAAVLDQVIAAIAKAEGRSE